MPRWVEEWMDLYDEDDTNIVFTPETPTEPIPPRRMLRARRRVRRIHTNGALGTGIAGAPGTVPAFGYPIPTMQPQPSIRHQTPLPPQNFSVPNSNDQSVTQMHFNRPPNSNFDTKARKILDRCDSKTDLQTLFGFGEVSNSCENTTSNLANQRESPWNQSTVLFRNPNYTESNMSININQSRKKVSKFMSQPSTSSTTSIVSNDLRTDTPIASTSDFSTVPTSYSTQFRHPFITPPGIHDRPSQFHLVKPRGQGYDFRASPCTSQPFFDFSHPNSQTDRSRQAGSLASPHTNTFTHSFDHTPQQQSSFEPTYFGISTQPIDTTSQTAYLHPSTSFQQHQHAGLVPQLSSTLQHRRNTPEISGESSLGQPGEEHNHTTPNFGPSLENQHSQKQQSESPHRFGPQF